MTPSDAPVLVTGAAGFLGSAIARALVDAGHRVLAFDRDHAQGRLPDHPAITRITGDVRNAEQVDALVAESSRVLHFAAVAGVHTYLQQTLEVLDVNLLGTRNVLLAAHRHDVPTVIASSSEAYGKNPTTLHEDSDTHLGATTHARWSYATTKVAGEHYAWALARDGLPVAAVRYFNVYGPLLDAPGTGRVLSQFLGQMQRGDPLVLVDGGEAVRCFCHIDDAVRATVQLALALEAGSRLAGRPFNIGNPEPVSMRQLAAEVARLAAYPHGTVDVPGRQFFGDGFEDIPHRVPDVSALRDLLGFEARVSLTEGLRETLAHWGLLADSPAAPVLDPIPVIRPFYDADEALIGRYRSALVRGRTTNAGPEVVALEDEASTWLGCERVLTVGSGAAGLELGVRALERSVRALERSGKAALPAFTYIATLNAVALAGLEPVFVDLDPDTWTMSPDHLAEVLRDHPDVSMVLPVCAYGVPPDLDRLCALAQAAGASVVYDAAHAFGTTVHGSRYRGGPDVTVFSLHATKCLPSVEGGLLVADDPALADRIAAIRTHGLTPDPLDALPGLNAKMDELSAATARHGLHRIEATLARRRRYGARLTAALDASERWTTQLCPEGVETNFQNLCARHADGVAAAGAVLDAHSVGWRRYFHPPLHQLRRLAPQAPLPHTEAVWASLVCLPLHSRMSPDTLARIEAAIADA
jgi:nucleoside-diphosphate-sugar epimerase/dTDP-4-amino-4,6-dideoxygalactose transaminase